MFLALTGCGWTEAPQKRAISAADDYRQAHGFAHDEGPKRPVTVRDDGEQWAVIYHVPKGYAGGDFIVFVDKQNSKAVSHVAWQ